MSLCRYSYWDYCAHFSTCKEDSVSELHLFLLNTDVYYLTIFSGSGMVSSLPGWFWFRVSCTVMLSPGLQSVSGFDWGWRTYFLMHVHAPWQAQHLQAVLCEWPIFVTGVFVFVFFFPQWNVISTDIYKIMSVQLEEFSQSEHSFVTISQVRSMFSVPKDLLPLSSPPNHA